MQAWDAHHRQASLNDSLLRSHVAIDNRQWTRFVSATRSLVQAQRGALAPEALAFALQQSLPAYQAQIASPGGSHLRDIGDVLSAVAAGADRALAAAAGVALEAGQAARIAVSAGTFREDQLGVHVFGGPPIGLPASLVNQYARLARTWAGASGWGELIEQLRTGSDGQPPSLAGASKLPALVGDPAGSPMLTFDRSAGTRPGSK